MPNYTVLHLHSDLSNGVTNIDSITKYNQYVDKAKELGMTAMAFSEHGSVFEWVKKKETIEKAGMKYIHAEEFYITESLDEKIRDNYHCLLIAKNYDGVKELNTLSSKSFNREDGHYYYVPRITYDELINTSDNIIISTACLGGILVHGTDKLRKHFIKFLRQHKDRCYLEIQHHNVEQQKKYNQYLFALSQKYNLQLVAMTDTHALNEEHLEGRKVLQKAKNISFDNEEGWDLSFKSYDELIAAYELQNSLPMDIVKQAIENTNVIADSVEEFELDRSYKYPHLWEDSEKLLWKKIKQGLKDRGVDKYPNRQEYADRIKYEMQAYKHNGAIDFMLLMEDIVAWCRTQNIHIGYGRGSVNGSVIAWVLGITEMDSIKHKLNFERFMNVERVSLSDIDTDFPPSRIEEVKQYIFNHHGLYCSDIITFNTIADKGAIRDVCRALYGDVKIPDELIKQSDEEVAHYGTMFDSTSNKIKQYYKKSYLDLSDELCTAVDNEEEYTKKKQEYPEIFKYVDLVKGVIVSIGNHPCGMVVSPQPLESSMGLCSTSTDNCPISQIYMKEIDGLNYVKLDLLKLDTIELISNTCEMAGIPMLLPDDLDINDVDVWNSMRDDTTAIFQWEGKTGDDYIKKLLSDKNIKKFQELDENVDRMTLLSIGNSAIRPAGASYREDLANGVIRSTGSKPIDDFLSNTFGYLVFQCQIIDFLHLYCGFTMGEADIVRRGFAKKTGTDQYIPIIKNGGYLTDKSQHYIDGYIKTMKDKYGIEESKSEEDIVAFIKVIEDASSYLFSLNHSQPYSYEGYACGYLRYHYPVEFLTCALNINKDNEDKTIALTAYARKQGIKISSIRFRHSVFNYSCDPAERIIYKGLASIKFMNESVSQELYNFRDNKYDSFIDLLKDIEQISCNSRQLEILIKLGFFEEFGEINQLLKVVEIYNFFKKGEAKQLSKNKIPEWLPEYLLKKHCSETEKQYKILDCVILLKEVLEVVKYPKTTLLDILEYEREHLGYIQTTIDIGKQYYYISDIKEAMLTLYQLKTGDTLKIKCRKKTQKQDPIEPGMIIKVEKIEPEPKYKLIKDASGKEILDKNGKKQWYRDENDLEEILQKYLVVKC